jgi:transcriptional regulator with GAF, ATPase, and Fis domain
MKEEKIRGSGFESLKTLLLQMAEERSVEALLRTIVADLGMLPHVALARLWLVRPGDICSSCHVRGECPDQTSCLHLAASEGRSEIDSSVKWSGLDGRFRRFPIGVRKVGQIASTGEALHVPDIEQDATWIADIEWARREGIRGFVGQPLIFKGEVLGVLAVFLRIPLVDEEGFVWLRMMADHAAAAIANAGAFEEIEQLKRRLELENEYLREEVIEAQEFGSVVGRSPAMRNALQQVDLVATTDASVLILGESGTGKELIAREIHRHSDRSDCPLIKVNCASIPRELYESEFFGHVRGAFTGALKDRAGRFEAADGGTLFLDEVGEIPLELQSKLLRVLQEGQYERVGEEKTRSVDVRIIAATNRDLKKEIDAGNFRNDLYFRLNVFPLEVTPLRQRKEDIAPLALHFLELASSRMNRPLPRLTQANILELQSYDWPGNVRELQNVIERAVITSRARSLRFELPDSKAAVPPPPDTPVPQDLEIVPEKEMRRRERENIVRALNATEWKIYGADGAAELLGLRPTTLTSRIKKFAIKRPK